jgi:hypothetical protein
LRDSPRDCAIEKLQKFELRKIFNLLRDNLEKQKQKRQFLDKFYPQNGGQNKKKLVEPIFFIFEPFIGTSPRMDLSQTEFGSETLMPR